MQLFQEFTAQVTKMGHDFEQRAGRDGQDAGRRFHAEPHRGAGNRSGLCADGTLGERPGVGDRGLANNPPVIDSSLQKVVDTFNAELGPDDQGSGSCSSRSNVNGRTWNTLKPGGLPFGIIWTYDRGYLVAASDRGVAERAIATRESGSSLVWSQQFLGQLPSAAGLHPSAFAWVNTKGALGMLSALAPSQALGELAAGRDPILVVFNGTPEQIRAASRTRITGLIMDVMLIDSLSQATLGQRSDAVRR